MNLVMMILMTLMLQVMETLPRQVTTDCTRQVPVVGTWTGLSLSTLVTVATVVPAGQVVTPVTSLSLI